jgi:hypothetical protein
MGIYWHRLLYLLPFSEKGETMKDISEEEEKTITSSFIMCPMSLLYSKGEGPGEVKASPLTTNLYLI